MNLDWQDIVIFGLEGGKLKLMGKVIEDGGFGYSKRRLMSVLPSTC